MDHQKNFYSRHGFRVLLVAVFLFPLIVLFARRTIKSNSNDVREWLPKVYQETTDYEWFKEKFGNEEFVVVTWAGCTPDDERLSTLAEKLVPTPPTAGEPKPFSPKDSKGNPTDPRQLFERVTTGRTLLDDLQAPPLNLRREEAVERLKGLLIGPDGHQTCAIITLTDDGKRHLRSTLDCVTALTVQSDVPASAIRLGGPPVVNAEIDRCSARSLMQLAGLSGVVGLLIAWWCFRTWRMTAMVFTTAVYTAAASLAVVSLTGTAMNAILMTMAPLVYVAGMSGAIHLANYYRDSVRDHGEAGAASGAVAHARVPLLLATSTTAIGLLSLCYSELLPIQHFGIYSAIGVIISLFTLFFFLPSMLEYFPPREKPKPRPVTGADVDDPLHVEGEDILSPGWKAFGQFVVRNNLWLSLAGMLLLCICGYGMMQVQTSIKIMRFFSRNSDIIVTYQWLEKNLGKLVPMEVIIRVDNERIDQPKPEVVAASSAADGQAPQPAQSGDQVAADQVAAEQGAAGQGPAATINQSPEAADPESPPRRHLQLTERMELVDRVQREIRSLHDVGSTMSAVTFAPEIARRANWPQEPGWTAARSVMEKKLHDRYEKLEKSRYMRLTNEEELWRISLRVGALNDVDYGDFVKELRAKVEPTLMQIRDELRRPRVEKLLAKIRQELPDQADEFEKQMQAAMETKTEEDRAAALEQLKAQAGDRSLLIQLVDILDSHEGVEATYTGMVPVVYKAQRSLLDGLIFGFGTDLLLIVTAIVVLLRHWSPGVMLTLTSLFPTTIVFGVMGWAGIVVDIGTVMTPSVALGVTVDDVVHFLLWFKRGLERGLPRGQAVMLAYQGCARAMYQSWGVIGLGLSMFAFSSFTPTMRFGALMVTLLTAGLFGNLVLLPALLAGPLGAFMQWKIEKQKAKQLGSSDQPPSPPAAERLPDTVGTGATELHGRAKSRSAATGSTYSFWSLWTTGLKRLL